MDVIIPDTSAFADPTVDERLDVFEGFDPCAAQGIRGELWTLRAEVERLEHATADALADAAAARVALEGLTAERDAALFFLRECASAVGAAVSPKASVEFHAQIPVEVKAAFGKVRAERDALARRMRVTALGVIAIQLTHGWYLDYADGFRPTYLETIDRQTQRQMIKETVEECNAQRDHDSQGDALDHVAEMLIAAGLMEVGNV